MKKIFFLIAAIFISIASQAQIQIDETFSNDLIIIGNISSGKATNLMGAMSNQPVARIAEHKLYCRVFKDKFTYGILIDTENKVDDDFEFALGTDISKAKESINQILTLMATKPSNTSVSVKDEDKRTIQINIQNKGKITLDAIDMNGATVCNQAYLTKANLERALKLLDNKAEKKVKERIEKNNM